MNYDRYVSKGGHVLWLQKRWDADDTRPVCLDGLLHFRTLKRVMRGRTAEYQVLDWGEIENAFRTVGDAMNWCLERLDQERGG